VNELSDRAYKFVSILVNAGFSKARIAEILDTSIYSLQGPLNQAHRRLMSKVGITNTYKFRGFMQMRGKETQLNGGINIAAKMREEARDE